MSSKPVASAAAPPAAKRARVPKPPAEIKVDFGSVGTWIQNMLETRFVPSTIPFRISNMNGIHLAPPDPSVSGFAHPDRVTAYIDEVVRHQREMGHDPNGVGFIRRVRVPPKTEDPFWDEKNIDLGVIVFSSVLDELLDRIPNEAFDHSVRFLSYFARHERVAIPRDQPVASSGPFVNCFKCRRVLCTAIEQEYIEEKVEGDRGRSIIRAFHPACYYLHKGGGANASRQEDYPYLLAPLYDAPIIGCRELAYKPQSAPPSKSKLAVILRQALDEGDETPDENGRIVNVIHRNAENGGFVKIDGRLILTADDGVSEPKRVRIFDKVDPSEVTLVDTKIRPDRKIVARAILRDGTQLEESNISIIQVAKPPAQRPNTTLVWNGRRFVAASG